MLRRGNFVMGNHELSPLMLYASHLFTRLHGLKNTLLAGLASSSRKPSSSNQPFVFSADKIQHYMGLIF